jgi:hypothetical protein
MPATDVDKRNGTTLMSFRTNCRLELQLEPAVLLGPQPVYRDAFVLGALAAALAGALTAAFRG